MCGMPWTPIPDLPPSEAHEDGSIRNSDTGKILTPYKSARGGEYRNVSLYVDKIRHPRYVHRLIALTFHGPPPVDRPQINHKDTDKTNNAASNLEYATNQENRDHAVANGLTDCGRGEAHGNAKLTENDVREIRRRYATGETQYAIGLDYAMVPGQISRIVNHKTWKNVQALDEEGNVRPVIPRKIPNANRGRKEAIAAGLVNVARGERVGGAKLTEADVRAIRTRCAAGEVQEAVGKDYGVSRPTVSMIVSRKVWAHVP